MRRFLILLFPIVLFAVVNNPSDLQLKALSAHSVSLKWQDNANNETGYKIFRDGEFIAVLAPNSTSYKDDNLQANTTYTYTVKASDDRHYNNVLFAHGYQSSKDVWDDYVDYINDHNLPWNVYRYSVGKDDHIATRARQLANYINSQKNIADHSIVAIGHSMGGLDLRYIVSLGHKNQSNKNDIFYKAAKKIKSIYTLATPHKGFADLGIDDATDDMTKKNMKKFNDAYPYSTYEIDGRKIPLLAYRFVCGSKRESDGKKSESDSGTDGVLKVKTQIFNGAPFTQSVFSGEHSDDVCLNLYKTETKQTSILDDILHDKKPYTDVADIVFYEKNSCKGDEGGVFSSQHKAGGVNCLYESGCEDNKIRSVKIYPGVLKDTKIKLYSDHAEDESDDWAVIDINNATLSKPVCIESFEKSYKDHSGIKVSYYPKDGGERGLDGKVSYIDITKK